MSGQATECERVCTTCGRPFVDDASGRHNHKVLQRHAPYGPGCALHVVFLRAWHTRNGISDAEMTRLQAEVSW